MKSRYIPLTQQPYCCVPTSLQIVMYKNGIPLQSQVDIGYELGLIVPKEDAYLFEKVHQGQKPPAGWGTRIYDPRFEINRALTKLNIPLIVEKQLISQFDSAGKLKESLMAIEQANGDALICFNYGKLWNNDSNNGHVCVFDRIEGDDVWMVDPTVTAAKHRKISAQKLFDAMKYHGDNKSGGLWIIRPK